MTSISNLIFIFLSVQYYESLLVEARSKKEYSIAEAVENAVMTRMQDLQCRLEICEDDKKSVLNVSSLFSCAVLYYWEMSFCQ